MDNQKKWDAFTTYDFSRSGEIARMPVGSPRIKSCTGMSAILTDIYGTLYYAREDVLKNPSINLTKVEKQVRKAYRQLSSRYNSIKFNELDPEDSDFAVFFNTKTAIDDLGRVIDSFFQDRQGTSELERVYENLKALMQQHTVLKINLENQVLAGV
jgi:hypothetical protein